MHSRNSCLNVWIQSLAICQLVSCATPVLAQTESKVRDLNNAGVEKMQHGDLKGASDKFTEAIKLQPDFNLPHTNRIVVRYRLHDFDGVIADYEDLRQQPRLLTSTSDLLPKQLIAESYFHRGQQQQQAGDQRAALKSFDEAISLVASKSEYYRNRAGAKREAGDTRGAEEDLAIEQQLKSKGK